MAVFYDQDGERVKTTHFGAIGYRDFTLIKDKQEALKARSSFLKRHQHDSLKDFTSASSLSNAILWGYSQDRKKNIMPFVKKHRLSLKR